MSAPIQNTEIKLSRIKRVMRGVFFATILVVGALLLFYRSSLNAPTPSNPFEPPEMTAARYAPRDVVGDLGGVAVTIPSHFANFVEYDGDPGFAEKRKGAVPTRTHQSKLRGFGYYTRFPDMAGESSPELRKDKRSYSVSKTPWILVGITTGGDYPGDGFLDRWTRARVETPNDILKYMNYEKLSAKEYGLTAYAAADIDPKSSKPYREDTNAEDVFVFRGKNGRVHTTIQCSNRNVPAPPCTHDFSLEPDMSAEVTLSYRRGQLLHWREMQEAVRQQILGFRVAPNTTLPTKP